MHPKREAAARPVLRAVVDCDGEMDCALLCSGVWMFLVSRRQETVFEINYFEAVFSYLVMIL